MIPVPDRRLRAIEELYRRSFRRFLRVALAIVDDRELAVEAVQDGIADAIRSRASLRRDESLEAWVWSAVVNAARTARGRRATVAAPETTSSNGYVEVGPGELGELIASLPERQRVALFLRHYADLDYRSIAATLGIEVGTVSATLAAAHAAVRRALKEGEA